MRTYTPDLTDNNRIIYEYEISCLFCTTRIHKDITNALVYLTWCKALIVELCKPPCQSAVLD